MDESGALRAADYFDAYGEKEWHRLEATVHGRVKYAIHRRFIDEYIHPGARVLDAGSGPGRFAIDMASRGASVTLLDISPGQLEAARQRLSASKVRAEDLAVGDVRDLSAYADGAFDAVVCFGGAVSYAFDDHEIALTELVRVCAPGGVLLLSVMSLLGTLTLVGTLDADGFLKRMPDHVGWLPGEDLPGVALTVPGSNEFHLPMALFTSVGLSRALEAAGCEVLRMAAANPVSRAGLPLARISQDDSAVEQLTALELAMCEAPGIVDSGEHIVAVARRPS